MEDVRLHLHVTSKTVAVSSWNNGTKNNFMMQNCTLSTIMARYWLRHCQFTQIGYSDSNSLYFVLPKIETC